MLVVTAGGEGDLRQGEVILGTGQCRVQHQDVALEYKEKSDIKQQQFYHHLQFNSYPSSPFLSDLGQEFKVGTSPSLSRGGKWKKRDCPRETLLIGLSRLSLLYSFT